MSEVKLYNGDCLEIMKQMPDNSIDLIVTDPPYNIGIDKWDKIDNYLDVFKKWINEFQRVLKPNGILYYWHIDFVAINKINNYIINNTSFEYNSHIIWHKPNYKKFGWQNAKKEFLQCWFNVTEEAFCFINKKGNPYEEIMSYFYKERKKIGWTAKDCDNFMGIKSSYSYWEKKTTHNYIIPKKENYIKLQKTGYWKKSYEEIEKIYNKKGPTHNLDNNHCNVWTSNCKNNGKIHKCQKPYDLIERMIRTSSKENDIVFDPFMGSGTTGVACKNLNRKFIGIELDKNYFNIAKERIEKDINNGNNNIR